MTLISNPLRVVVIHVVGNLPLMTRPLPMGVANGPRPFEESNL